MRRGEQTANARGRLSRCQALLVPPCCWLDNWNAIALTGSASRTGLSFVPRCAFPFICIHSNISQPHVDSQQTGFLKGEVLRSSVCFVGVSAASVFTKAVACGVQWRSRPFVTI